MSEDRLLSTTEPNIGQLRDELTRSRSDQRNVNRILDADKTRYAYWHGQTADGRKYTAETGERVYPWEGASDARILMADHYCDFYTSLLAGSDERSALNVNPTEYSDVKASGAVKVYMAWLTGTVMAPNWEKELELVKQYAGHYGWAGVHSAWKRSIQNTAKRITLESLASFVGMQPGQEQALSEVLANQTDFLADMFAAQNPQFKAKEVRQHFKQLREEGETTLEVPSIVCDYPEIVALKPYYELLFPPETRDIKSARVVFRRDSMTVAELEDMVEADDWDEEWVEKVKRTAGLMQRDWDDGISPGSRTLENSSSDENLIEVCYAYSRRVDEDGNPGIYLTVFSPYQPSDERGDDTYARHELVPEAKGKIPISVFTRESTTREIVESRGIPDICSTWQTQIKAQKDMLFDRASMTTVPPLKVPQRYGNRIVIGPGMQLPEQRQNDITWMDPPKQGPSDALANIESIKAMADEYFGVPNPTLERTVAQIKNQNTVNRWLGFKSEVLNDVWDLVQTFGSDQEFAEVTGTGIPIPRDRNRYNFQLKFDIRELDSEHTINQLKAVAEIVAPMDSAGVLDHAKLIEAMLMAINPSFADQLIMAESQASQQMFDEENGNMALMSLGNQPKLRENDPTAQIRAEFVNQILTNNPKYQEQLKSDPMFAELLETYMQNLQMSIMQQQNAVTGRLGVSANG